MVEKKKSHWEFKGSFVKTSVLINSPVHVTSTWLTVCGSTCQKSALHYTGHISLHSVCPLSLALSRRAAQGHQPESKQTSRVAHTHISTVAHTHMRALHSFYKSDKSTAVHHNISSVRLCTVHEWNKVKWLRFGLLLCASLFLLAVLQLHLQSESSYTLNMLLHLKSAPTTPLLPCFSARSP